MIKRLLKNTDFALLIVVLAITSIGLYRAISSKPETLIGKVEEISCEQARKSETKFVFSIKLENSAIFSNKIESSCNKLEGLKKGETVTVEVFGHWLQQIKHRDKFFFDLNKTERNRKDNVAFLIIFFFGSLGGLIFKLYSRMNNLKKNDLC